jgi:VanZ family protein
MLYKLKGLLIKIFPYDKLQHFVVGLVLGNTTKSISSIWLNVWYARLIAMALVTVIAIVAEVADKKSGKGTPEKADTLYTIAGGIIGMI